MVAGPARVIAADVLDVEDQRPHRDIRFASEVRVFVRGVDALEPSQTCIVEEQRRWYCATAAEQALRAHLRNRLVTCRDLRTDEQDRTFGECQVEGEEIAVWLVTNGWALADPKTGGRLRDLEKKAKQNKIGIWKSRFDPPWKFREETPLLSGK
ncbi:MAG: thermonuclease family protein [Magnetococcales bacterium]|nr:thermonuclease family protein [Magnetococcales bacterium]NGZ05861.1 thermonuclease family protein [Magnetococcales bacterium]